MPGNHRAYLYDKNKGEDRINAAAVITDTYINLDLEKTARIAGRTLTIKGDIEQAVTGDGNDTLIGNALANYLSGGRSNDILDGRGGKDYLDGGKGNDTLTGGAETDLFFIQPDPISIDIITDFETETEQVLLIRFHFTSPNLFVMALLDGAIQDKKNTRIFLENRQIILFKDINRQDLRPQNFVMLTNKMDLSDYLIGIETQRLGYTQYKPVSPDCIRGNEGNDILVGGEGDDRLIGGPGQDHLNGMEGNDILFLEGDVGAIINGTNGYFGTRVGGPGADVFKSVVYAPCSRLLTFHKNGFISACNLIADFNPDEDIIDLSIHKSIRSFHDLDVRDCSIINPSQSGKKLYFLVLLLLLMMTSLSCFIYME